MLKTYTLLFISITLFGGLHAQQHRVKASHIIEGELLGETVPLSAYKPNPNAPNEVVKTAKWGYHPKEDWILNEFVNPDAKPVGPDPAWQQNYAAPNMGSRSTTVQQDYPGIPFTGVNPPDPVMDVGPNHVMQMVNAGSGAQFQVWDKNGNSLAGPTQMDNFFNSAINGGSAFGKGDPIVLYDQLADRWFMAEFSANSNDIYILISTSADPTGTWYAYTFTAPNFPDYLKFAIWPDAYTMTSNESGPSGVYAFDRTAMLSGSSATLQRFTVPDNPALTFQATTPVGVEGPTAPPAGNNAYFMRMTDDGWSGNIPSDRLEIWELDVDFATPGNSTFTGPVNLSTAPFDTDLCGYISFSCMDQPGGGIPLDPIREVLMFKVQYRNFGTHESIVCNHTTDLDQTDRGAIRWYELRRTGNNPWSIYQQGTYSPDADHRWMGAININANGQIGLLYNRSSSTTFPGIYLTGRNPDDPPGTMSVPETVIVSGSASNGSNRYGDYSTLSVDPSDEYTFWGTAEYNPGSQWSTRIASFTIEGSDCAAVPLSVDDNPILPDIYQASQTISSSGTVNAGTSVTFQAGQSIILQPDFHAKTGSDFLAFIEDCAPVSMLRAGTTSQDRPMDRIPPVEPAAVQKRVHLSVAPNPFRQETLIRYTLPDHRSAQLVLFDLLGRARILQPTTVRAAGYQEYRLSSRELSSGIYFIRLQAGEDILTRRVQLIKN